MEELLKKLLEAEILSPDVKKDLEEAFKKQVTESIGAAKEEAAKDTRAELTEQWVKERDALIEALDQKMDVQLKSEIEELKSDIDRFRDLEAEHAEKIVEAKGEMATELKGDLAKLIEKLDTFLEMRLGAEMAELREDVDSIRKNQFGRRVFEAIVDEYRDHYADPEAEEVTRGELTSRLSDTQDALTEAEKKIAEMVREKKMAEVLSPLTGRARDVMEAILKNVETSKLDEGYKTFIGRVIREAKIEEKSEKEGTVLVEKSSSKKGDDKGAKADAKKLSEAVVITGDDSTVAAGTTQTEEGREEYNHLRRLAGVR